MRNLGEKACLLQLAQSLSQQSRDGEARGVLLALVTLYPQQEIFYPESPSLVPALLWQEGVEKLKALKSRTQQSEDVGEIKTLLYQHMALEEWVNAQKLP